MARRTRVEDLRRVFVRGDVFAERWSDDVRRALHVDDPLVPEVAAALQDGRSVVISGNAGDGKSHLAQMALEELGPDSWTENPEALNRDRTLFIRDVSGLRNEEVVAAKDAALGAGSTLLITINEGPLSSLADSTEDAFFQRVQEVLHARANGLETEDPEGCLVLTLAGRNLTRSDFVSQALVKFLPAVPPCGVCPDPESCPRIVGARSLEASGVGKERLGLLLQLVTAAGRHLTARDIWLFLIDLFLGWTCEPSAGELDNLEGHFWSRVFENDSFLSEAITAEFDPLLIARPADDASLWSGHFASLDTEVPYPGTAPASLARRDEDDGIAAFRAAKRFLFFFSTSIDAEESAREHSAALRFSDLLERATERPEAVLPALIGLINEYRMSISTENDLWASRHHSFAAHRRTHSLAAYSKVPLAELELRLPYKYYWTLYPEAGFFPESLLLLWRSSNQVVDVDFGTWVELQQSRTLTTNATQELLDLSLDLFLSQAPVPVVENPEVAVYNHKRREMTSLKIRTADKQIGLLDA